LIEDLEPFWDELLAFVEAKSVIPIIGPELAVVEYEGRREPYHRLLARHLAVRLKLTGMEESPALHEVVSAYLSRPGAKRQSIYRELGYISSKLQVDIPQAYLQLAGISDFTLYASFCTDDMLVGALNQVRFDGRKETLEHTFTPNEASDLNGDAGSSPSVYGLFGRMSVLPKYVAAEEDMIEWLSALQDPGKRPAHLFDEFGNNHLLFLGCRFPDWLTRFILRTTKNNKLSLERGFSEYFVDSHASTAEDAPLVSFLSSFSRETEVIQLDPVDFVAEFARRWQERQAPAEPATTVTASMPAPSAMPDTMPPGSLFISYASEDRPAAMRLANTLQAAGLPVWLDRQQLDWGSDYTARIRVAIEQCGLFLPILSHTAEQRLGFYRKEWAWAVERDLEFTGATVSFLFPLVIDDTAVFTSGEIPPAFKSRHIEQAPDGQLSAAQAESIAAAFHAMRERIGRHA